MRIFLAFVGAVVSGIVCAQDVVTSSALAIPPSATPLVGAAAESNATLPVQRLIGERPNGFPDGRPGEEFGTEVVGDGDTAAVGAPFDGTSQGDRAGSVYVFVREQGAWQLQAKLVGAQSRRGSRFGSAVALSGHRLIVAAPCESSATCRAQVYAFERSNGTWSARGTLDAGTIVVLGYGTSVALSGDRALIGNPGFQPSGQQSLGAA